MGKVSLDDKMRIQSPGSIQDSMTGISRDCCEIPSELEAGPAHTAKLAQNWIATNYNDFIGKDEWPPNSPNINPLD